MSSKVAGLLAPRMKLRRGVDARIEGFYVEGLHRLSRRGEGKESET